MKQSKKLVITIAILAVMLFAMTMGLIVVLVLSNQRAKSNINVKYTASDVMVKISAKAYEGVNTYTFKNGTSTTLELSPNNMEGSLSQTQEEIILSKSSPRIIFEYKFENMTSDIDAVIANDGIPATQENVKLSYAISDSKVNMVNTDFESILDFEDTYTTQLLPAYPNASQNVRYVYVMAEIESLVHDAEFSGDFVWGLSKPADVQTVSVQNNLSQTPTVAAKYLTGTEMFEPGFDQYNNQMFEAFYTDNTYTTRVSFPYTPTGSETFYAKYIEGSAIPASNIEYDEASDSYHIVGKLDSSYTNNTLVIPDLYNDGEHGVKPITRIEAYEQDGGFYGLLCENTVISNLYIGNSVNYIYRLASSRYGSDYAGGTNNCLQYAYVGRSVQDLEQSFFDCRVLETIEISTHLSYIHSSCYTMNFDSEYLDNMGFVNEFCRTMVSIIHPYNNANKYIMVGTADATDVADIKDYDKVTEIIIASFYDSKIKEFQLPEFVNDISYMFARSDLQTIVLHNKLFVVGRSAFYGCEDLRNITIPNSVKVIKQYAFSEASTSVLDAILHIPTSVEKIEPNAFYKTFFFLGGNLSGGGLVFDGSGSTWEGKSLSNTITVIFGGENGTIIDYFTGWNDDYCNYTWTKQ